MFESRPYDRDDLVRFAALVGIMRRYQQCQDDLLPFNVWSEELDRLEHEVDRALSNFDRDERTCVRDMALPFDDVEDHDSKLELSASIRRSMAETEAPP